MPRGINGEYYKYKVPYGRNYLNPLILLYNILIHSADSKNPYLITGTAPTAQIKFNNFIKGESLAKENSKLLDLMYADWKPLLKRLKDLGVITDKASVIKALRKRENLIHKTAPKEYIDHTLNITLEGNILTLNIDGKRNIGDLLLLMHSDNTIYPSMVRNNTINLKNPIKGVSEKLYNSAIQLNKSLGYKGFKVGEVLSSPEKTTKVYLKFPNKKLVSKKGLYYYNDEVKEGPIYILKLESTNVVPTKSRLFDIESIDNNGIMHIDWNNSNIFRIGIPLVIGTDVYRRDEL